MTSLTISSHRFAEAEVQAISLHPLVGAYELWFGLNIVAMPRNASMLFHAVFDGARVRVKASGGRYRNLGFARADTRIEIETKAFLSRITSILPLPLQVGQIVGIERLRNASDLHFELLIRGTGSIRECGESVQEIFQEVLYVDVPRSDWIEKLRAAGARNTLLFEVPLPLLDQSEERDRISEEVLRAESQFRNGDYRACVASCRTIAHELGYRKSGNGNWANESLDRFRTGRAEMSKDERDLASLAALRHCAHPAHHGTSEGGEINYSRADAEHMLSLAAAFVSRWLSE